MVDGFLEDLVQAFGSRLNFSLRQFSRIDGQWTPQDPLTKQFGGMVKNIRMGEADFITAHVGITVPRTQDLSFLQPVSVGELGFVVKRQKTDTLAWEVFTSPFQSILWLVLAIVSVISAFLLYLMHKYPQVHVLKLQ